MKVGVQLTMYVLRENGGITKMLPREKLIAIFTGLFEYILRTIIIR